MSRYRESQDLINIGAYSPGSNKDIDEAIEKVPLINEFLRQSVGDRFDFEDTLEWIGRILG